MFYPYYVSVQFTVPVASRCHIHTLLIPDNNDNQNLFDTTLPVGTGNGGSTTFRLGFVSRVGRDMCDTCDFCKVS